ncbi:MAG: hypothetical protein P8Y70_00900 [Candidatus Lokiarchaeota archaeon]
MGKNYILIFLVLWFANLITVSIVNSGVWALETLMAGNPLSIRLIFLIVGVFVLESVAIGIEYFFLNSLFKYIKKNNKISQNQDITGNPLLYYVIFANIISFGIGSMVWGFLVHILI